jgi:hypothetical protein
VKKKKKRKKEEERGTNGWKDWVGKKKKCKIGKMAKVRGRRLGQKKTYDIIYP